MLQIIQANSQVVSVVAKFNDYLEARREVEELSTQYGLTVADMPIAIQAMASLPNLRAILRPNCFNTITSECHGLRNGDLSYETWHSVGAHVTQKGLEDVLNKISKDQSDFGIIIDANEWVDVGEGKYLGDDVARVHLEDVKKDDVPKVGTPYTVFVRLNNKDNPTINVSSELSYDEFMKDDRILMLAGSLDNREALVKMLFTAKNDGGEGFELVGSYHRIHEVGLKQKIVSGIPRGFLVSLLGKNLGMFGYVIEKDPGHFFAVDEGVL